VEIERYPAVFEPVVKEGHTAAAVMEITMPKMYIGFDYRRDNVELASARCGQGLANAEASASSKRPPPAMP
jgi:hypothetical protein